MNKNELDIEELLYSKLPEIEEKVLNELPCDEDINHVFSLEFENKLNKLIKKDKKRTENTCYRYFKKVVIIFLIVLTGLITITTVNTEAFPENLMRMMKKIYKEFTDYNFINPNIEKTYSYKEPEYISFGYKEVERVKEDDYLVITYKDKLDNYIVYQTMQMNRDVVSLNTEGTKTENIRFDNHYAQYVEKGNTQQLLWDDKNNIYILSKELATKKITKKDKIEFIKIAENIR
ncbi:DUF4367 domain-containing protein [Clostridioides sp. GD02404]|uniref:DUF4367 domain-containing protein n=1 Tax=Clostridioides sp. GD02404 TaxID=3054354 RepID=UPI0038ACE105